MQSLDVISINLWQILISLVNLLLLCLIIKKFLFKPVKNMLKKRQDELDAKYKTAEEAILKANSDEKYWKDKRESLSAEAEEIIEKATIQARKNEERRLAEAKEKAEDMLRNAKKEIELEREMAEESVKKEIVEVATAIAQKMISREINAEDHRSIIDSAIENMGD